MAAVSEVAEPAPPKEKKNDVPVVPWLPAVAERYEARKKLGENMCMFGDVYKAWDRVSKRFVAVKQVFGRKTDDDRLLRTPLQYFEQEVTSLKACQGHPNVVQLLATYTDSSRDDGDSFIVTEYAGPMNLREYMNWLRKNGEVINEDEVCDIMEQLLAGARHVHRSGVLHRDIVPENVVVDWDTVDHRLVCKICGFGMSMPADQADKDGTGRVATSTQYRAPELELESNDYGDRVDTWALGGVMADLIAGKSQYKEEWVRLERPEPLAHMALKHQKYARQGSFPPEKEQMVLLSAAGMKVLKGLLEINPEHRLSAAAALTKPWFRRLQGFQRSAGNQPGPQAPGSGGA